MTFDGPGKWPPLSPKLLETVMRTAKPWVPVATPADGNGTPPHVSEVLCLGDRFMGVAGFMPCSLETLGEAGRELLTELLQSIAEALSAAVYQTAIARLESDLRLARVGNALTPLPLVGGPTKLQSKRLVGNSSQMRDLDGRIDRAAATDATVLIQGETGTGKELVAQEIHARSPRRRGPFVDQHMGALPDDLIEAVIMGYVKDIHSQAHKDKPGQFELADKGTYFMDEVGLTTLIVQEKFLRVLQERKVRRIGSEVSFDFDTRIIAASNRDLQELVREGKMREDFFYRLKVVTIPIPPLRHHLEDLPALFEYFTERLACKWSLPALRDHKFDSAWAALLGGWSWPGNVRELENTVEEVVTNSGGAPKLEELEKIMDAKRNAAGIEEAASGERISHAKRMENAEANFLRSDLRESNGSVRKAAEKNGLSEPTMRRKATRYHLSTSSGAQK
ncbi:MAG: sigma 54-interacting transcriptional regulator [Planctomycetota bacterium]